MRLVHYLEYSGIFTGCLQIQPKKFPVGFQDTFNKFPVDFLMTIDHD